MNKELIDKLMNGINFTKTDNGALSHETTKNGNLDLFGSNLRVSKNNETLIIEILKKFDKAFKEDEELALLNFFNIIDVRGGKGEKGITPFLILYLGTHYEKLLVTHLDTIVELSRWDRLLNNYSLFSEYVKGFIIELITRNFGTLLMYKWLPSIGASNSFTIQNAKEIAKDLGISQREYRIYVADGRKRLNLIENNLRAKTYENIEIKKIPKLALKKYNKVLWGRMNPEMTDFSKALSKGEIKINVDVLTPFDFYTQIIDGTAETISLYDSMWTQMKKIELNCLPVIDVSASMSGNPEKVAKSLGVYVSEQNKGAFKNKVFLFSEDTKVLDLGKFETFSQKLEHIEEFNDVANTNLSSVFEKVLELAKENIEDLPKNILLISDMQFDNSEGWDDVIYKKYKLIFEKLGVKFPNIIFWNVNAPDKKFPILKDDIGVAMLYGSSIYGLEVIKEFNSNSSIEMIPMTIMNMALKKYKNFLK